MRIDTRQQEVKSGNLQFETQHTVADAWHLIIPAHVEITIGCDNNTIGKLLLDNTLPTYITCPQYRVMVVLPESYIVYLEPDQQFGRIGKVLTLSMIHHCKTCPDHRESKHKIKTSKGIHRYATKSSVKMMTKGRHQKAQWLYKHTRSLPQRWKAFADDHSMPAISQANQNNDKEVGMQAVHHNVDVQHTTQASLYP